MSTSDIQQLLGEHPSSSKLAGHLASLTVSHPPPPPEVKSYPDAVYLNYFPLGLSFQFKPINGYKPRINLTLEELKANDLVLDGVDIYNSSTVKPESKIKPAYATYPVDPVILNFAPIPGKTRPETLKVTPRTIGKEFVEALGEPDRKGGGAGPSSGSINIWCEWPKDGIMVEFAGEESRGPQAWERGKDAVWKVITVFPPKKD